MPALVCRQTLHADAYVFCVLSLVYLTPTRADPHRDARLPRDGVKQTPGLLFPLIQGKEGWIAGVSSGSIDVPWMYPERCASIHRSCTSQAWMDHRPRKEGRGPIEGSCRVFLRKRHIIRDRSKSPQSCEERGVNGNQGKKNKSSERKGSKV